MSKKINNTDELKKYQKDYSDSKLWNKLAKFAGKLGNQTVYQVLVLYYMMKSSDVSIKDKSIILGALGYLILPLDLIPDAIPVLGFTDDVSAIAMAYKTIQSSITPDIEEKANRKLAEWF